MPSSLEYQETLPKDNVGKVLSRRELVRSNIVRRANRTNTLQRNLSSMASGSIHFRVAALPYSNLVRKGWGLLSGPPQ